MVNRIKILIEKQKLTATQFAEEIGVQRSAVSHLLSGRNKPSLDFILKIKKRFSDVRLEWLILGQGKMNESKQENIDTGSKMQHELFQPEMELRKEKESTTDAQIQKTEIPLPMTQSVDGPSNGKTASEDKQTPTKVILLFPDNTFKVFNPR